MAYHEGVTDAFSRLRKTTDPPKGAKLIHASIPPREHLVAITLVPHVKDDTVPLRSKDPVKGHRQFYRPQIGGQMAPPPGDHLHQTLPKLGAQGLGFGIGDQMEIIWDIQQGPAFFLLVFSTSEQQR